MEPGSTERKHVILTGGASGIGLAITRSLAEQGAHVSVLDVNAEGASVVEELAKAYPAADLLFKHTDVSNWVQLASAFKETHEKHGRIDVVIANAGISREKSFLVDEEEPSKPALETLEVNLLGVIYSGVKLGIHYMKQNVTRDSSKGSIICTASMAGLYPFPVAPIYAGSKSGIIGLVRSLAKPLDQVSIQVNALAPTISETNIAGSTDLFKSMIVTPMSTISNAVNQLLSDPTLTGQIAVTHESDITLVQPPPYVDEGTRKNLDTFWQLLGYSRA